MNFTYSPLEDAAAQIRLVRICSFNIATEIIELRMTSHFVRDAPDFVAISYTWGSPSNLCSVSLNSTRFQVRENCYKALLQYRQQNIKQHIWIDSICIDQDNVDEKGPQVAMMSSLYRNASQVLVSIQPSLHSEPRAGNTDSTTLVELANVARESLLAETLHQAKINRDNLDSLVDEGATLLAERRLPLRDGINGIVGAEYWTRLWILQELAMSKRACLMLHGDLVDLEALYLLTRISDRLERDALGHNPGGNPDEGPGGSTDQNQDDVPDAARAGLLNATANTPMGLALAVRYMAPESSGLDLAGVLVRYSAWRCYDPRDRIYGTMAFIHWTGDRPIRVDYAMSKAELAVRVLDHHNNQIPIVQLVRVLVRALELSFHDVQELIRSAKSPELTCTLRTIYNIRIAESIPVAADAVNCHLTQGTDTNVHGEESQLTGRESYPVVKANQEETGLRPESVSTKDDNEVGGKILTSATVMLDQGVRTKLCAGCSHPGFVSEPRSPPRQYLEPGDFLFSGLGGPGSHEAAMAVILKIQPAVEPGTYTYCAADLADLLCGSNYCQNCFCAGYQGPDDNASTGHVAALTVLDIFILASRVRDVMQLAQPCHHGPQEDHMRTQHELRGAQIVNVSTSSFDHSLQDESNDGIWGGNH